MVFASSLHAAPIHVKMERAKAIAMFWVAISALVGPDSQAQTAARMYGSARKVTT